MTFYDRNGKPMAYTEDDIHIYLFSGKPVAYFDGNAVFGFNGKHMGWFEKGWIRDIWGACVFFTENASGSGPMKPMKQMRPMKCMKQMKPMKAMRQMKRMKPMNQLSWSALSGESFFYQ